LLTIRLYPLNMCIKLIDTNLQSSDNLFKIMNLSLFNCYNMNIFIILYSNIIDIL